MLDRIKADTPEPARRLVAEKIRDEAVRRFVESDRDDCRDDPDCREVDRIRAAHLIDPAIISRLSQSVERWLNAVTLIIATSL